MIFTRLSSIIHTTESEMEESTSVSTAEKIDRKKQCRCGSRRTVKKGQDIRADGLVRQRYKCHDCGKTFYDIPISEREDFDGFKADGSWTPTPCDAGWRGVVMQRWGR